MNARFRHVAAGLAVAVALSGPAPARAQTTPDLGETMESARGAGVPRPDIDRVLALGLRYGLSERDTATLLAATTRASVSGRAVEPVVDKVEEGLAKKVAVASIVTAVEKRTADYLFVQRLLAAFPDAGPELVERLANTLRMGLSQQDVAGCAAQTGRSAAEIVGAAEFFAAVRQAGVDAELAAVLTSRILQRENFPGSLLDLAQSIRDAKEKGYSDAAVLGTAARVVDGSLSIADARTALGLSADNDGAGSASGRGDGGAGSGQGAGRGAGAGAGRGGGPGGGAGGGPGGGGGGPGGGGSGGGAGGGGGGRGGRN
uniref:Uncharacterized protein n=1 Tax=Desulfovibrio sp. U5L TaxID=596152 RepID=I2PZZ9_9BACT